MTEAIAQPLPTIRWCGRLLLVWLLIRTLHWFVVIVFSHPNAPLDLIEWLSWGHSLQWGYPKHPPLPAWLAVAFAHLSPGDVWGDYLLGYLCAAGCFAAAWTLGLRYLSPPLALCGALCLEGLMYLTNDPAEWSNNVALSLGWAWTIVLGEKAVRTNRVTDWIAVGAVIGLTLLCKYTLGVLLIPLAAFLVWDSAGRRCLRSAGPYLAVLVAAIVFAPHAVWMVQHDFVTLKYAVERSEDSNPLGHVLNPFLFLGGQIVWLLPVLVILMPWRRSRSPISSNPEVSPSSAMYLHFAVLGPLVVLIAISVTTGCQLREIWGSPLWTFFGVWFLVRIRANWNPRSFRRSLILAWMIGTAMLAFTLTKQFSTPYLTGKAHRPHYPGKALADEVNARWNARYSVPFPIAAGEAWAAGNVCCYSRHRPVLFSSGAMGALEFDPVLSPWTSDADLSRRGGVIVWDALQLGDGVPAQVSTRFPTAIAEPAIELPYETAADLPPIRVGLAIIPPQR